MEVFCGVRRLLLCGVLLVSFVDVESTESEDSATCALMYESNNFSGRGFPLTAPKNSRNSVSLFVISSIGSIVVFPGCKIELQRDTSDYVVLREGSYSNSNLKEMDYDPIPQNINIIHTENTDNRMNLVTCAIILDTGAEVRVSNYGSTSLLSGSFESLMILEGCKSFVVYTNRDVSNPLAPGVYNSFSGGWSEIYFEHTGDITQSCLLYGNANSVVSFDDSVYDFWSQSGEFWALKSSVLDVQVRLDESACVDQPGVSCISAVAVRVNDGISTSISEFEFSHEMNEFTIFSGNGFGQMNFQTEFDGEGTAISFRGLNHCCNVDNEIPDVVIEFSSSGPSVRITAFPNILAEGTGLCGNQLAQSDDTSLVVSKEESLFSTPAAPLSSPEEEFPSNLPFSEFPQCDKFSASWIVQSCNVDMSLGADASVALFGGLMSNVCEKFCAHGVMDFGISEDVCNSFCEESFDLHGAYGDYTLPETSLMPIQQDTKFSASLSGQYTLQANVIGNCDEISGTVVVNVQCENDFSISLPEEINVKKSDSGYPTVRLPSPVSVGGEIKSVSWKVRGISESVILRMLHASKFGVLDADFRDRFDTIITEDTLYEFLFREYNFQGIIDAQFNEYEPSQFEIDVWNHLDDFLSGQVHIPPLTQFDILTEEFIGLMALEEYISGVFTSLSPVISLDNMPNARVTPFIPGTYIIELAATDGCSISKQDIRLNVLCSECVEVVTTVQHLNTNGAMIYETITINGNETIERNRGNLIPAFMYPNWPLDDFQFAPVGDFGRPPEDLDYFWNFESDKEHVTEEGGGGITVTFTNLIEVRSLANHTEFGNVTEISEVIESSVLGSSISYSQNVENINSPPEIMFHSSKQFWQKTTTITEEIHTLQQYYSEVYTSPCSIDLEDIDSDVLRTRYRTGATGDLTSCVGNHKIFLDTFDGCDKSTYEFDFSLQCGVPPVAYINCMTGVEFDYLATKFPTIIVDGSMSYSLSGASPLIFSWTAIDGPVDNTENPVRFGRSRRAVGDDENEEMKLPNFSGVYTIELTVSDGCAVATTTAQVEGFCFSPPKLQLRGYEFAEEITLSPIQYSGTATLLKDFSAADSQWEAPVGTLQYSWELIELPIDEEQEIMMSGSRLDKRYERAFSSENENYRADFYLGGTWGIRLSGSDGCETSEIDIIVPIECGTTITANPGTDFTSHLDVEGGRVYLRTSKTTWMSEGDRLNENQISFDYEWVWISWPEELGETPPSLQDNRVLIVDSTERNIYDPISAPDGQFTLVPDDFRDGNYLPKSSNPSSEVDATSFAPPIVGEYILKLVVTDGCSVDATKDEPQEGEFGHLKITVDCLNLQSPQILVADSHELDRFEPLEMDGNDPHFFPELLGISYLWTIREAPEGSVCFEDPESEDCQDVINAARTTVAAFWPDTIGTWTIEFGLQSSFCGTRSVETPIEVLCSRPRVVIESLEISGNTFWHDGKFDILTLSGVHEESILDFDREVDFWWSVISAPEGSSYVPQCNEESPCVEEETEIEIYNAIHQFTNGTENEVNRTTTTTVITEYYSYVQLTETSDSVPYDDLDTFKACFIPDIPGGYEFELTVEMDCGQTTRTISTVVECNSPPIANAGEDQIVEIEENQNFIEVHLDGSLSADEDENDRITYEWDWALPYDEWSEDVFHNMKIQNFDSISASFLAPSVGIYELVLTVSDGCSTSQDIVVIDVQCGHEIPQTTEIFESTIDLEIEAGTNAFDMVTVIPSIFGEVNECNENVEWSVVNYSV